MERFYIALSSMLTLLLPDNLVVASMVRTPSVALFVATSSGAGWVLSMLLTYNLVGDGLGGGNGFVGDRGVTLTTVNFLAGDDGFVGDKPLALTVIEFFALAGGFVGGDGLALALVDFVAGGGFVAGARLVL